MTKTAQKKPARGLKLHREAAIKDQLRPFYYGSCSGSNVRLSGAGLWVTPPGSSRVQGCVRSGAHPGAPAQNAAQISLRGNLYLAPGLAGPRPWPPEKVAGDDRKSQDKSQARCPGKGLRVTVPGVLCGGGRPSRGTHAQLGPSPTPPSRKPQPTEIIPKRGRPASLTPSLALSSLSGRHCLCQAPGLPWAPSCPENTSRMTAGSAVWNHFEDEDS